MKKHIRLLSMLLVIGMVFGELPFFAFPTKAASNGCIDVYVGYGQIGNNGADPSDLMPNFGRVPGFTVTDNGVYKRTHGSLQMKRREECTFTVKPADNEILAALAQKGSGAQYKVWWKCKCEKDFHEGTFHNDYYLTHVEVSANGNNIKSGRAYCDGEKWHEYDTGWCSFEELNTLKIKVWCDATCGKCGSPAYAEVKLYIKDETAPKLTDYNFTTNGTVNPDNPKELFIKLGTKAEDNPETRYDADNTYSSEDFPYIQNYIDMTVNFSEPVGTQTSVNNSQQYAKIPDNAPTGAENEYQALKNATYTYDEAVAGMETLAGKLAKAEEAKNEVRGCEEIFIKALNAIIKDDGAISSLIGQTETKTITIEDEGITTKSDVTIDCFMEKLYETAGISTTPVEGEDAPKTFSDEDIGYLNAAATAVKDLTDSPTNNQKLIAAFNAIKDAKVKVKTETVMTGTDGEEEQEGTEERSLPKDVKTAITEALGPTEPTEEQTEETAGEPTVESCVKAMCEARVAAAADAYNSVKTDYDTAVTKVSTANTAVQSAREAYNQKLDKLQASQQVPDEKWNTILKHQLFNNTLGTGYIRMGMPCCLELYTGHSITSNGWRDYVTPSYIYAVTNGVNASGVNILGRWNKSLGFRYTAQRGDFNGNKCIDYGGGITSPNSYSTTSLINQLVAKGLLYDAAGNPVEKAANLANNNIFDSSITTTNNTVISVVEVDEDGKVVETSSEKVGGFNVIVDAEPPTYTRTGNGITPDILTRMVLNTNDGVDFIVSFSEATITKRGWDNAKTYLLFNNGARAYFKGKSDDGKLWTFHYDLKDETETTLWLAIALCNDALDESLKSGEAAVGSGTRKNIANYSIDADARTITDYVGNIMADRANEDSLTNNKQIESSTGWANLAIDNTKPVIEFSYNRYNAYLNKPEGNKDGTITDVENPWGQAGKIYINASDPSIATPPYNPDQSEASRPGSGIWRPDNATSAGESESSAKGMVFYVWTRDATPPDVGTNYELLKRFSLAAWDKNDVSLQGVPDCYKQWVNAGLVPTMVNNFSEIAPPDEAFTSEGSGEWYLHVWTADMSWDSARQLMQYELMYDLKYRDKYRPSSALALKMKMIEEQYQKKTEANIEAKYTTEHASNELYTYENAWNAVKNDYDYDDAWNDVKEKYFKAIYTDTYLQYLNESGKDIYSDDAETYARNQTMKLVGDYSSLTDKSGVPLWTWDKFKQEDSNWTYNCATVCFDNTASTVTVDKAGAVGDGTKSVKLPFTAKDAHSGVKEVSYQWVRQPDGTSGERPESTKDVSEVGWVSITPDNASNLCAVTFTVDTASADAPVSDDGTYYLSVKVTDRAGNITVIHTEETVTVNTSITIDCKFAQNEEEAEYYRSVTPNFRVSEIKIAEVKYAVTNSVSRPDDSEFKEITSENPEAFKKLYTIPELNKEGNADGTWYVHVLVTEDTPTPPKPYYFYHAYKIDNTAPTLYLDPSSGGLEKATNSVTVTAIDALSGVDEKTLVYIWTKSATAPEETAEGWTVIASGSPAVKTITDPKENGSYYIHVRVKDKAGNITVMSSGAFLFKVAGKEIIPAYGSTLVTVYKDEKSGIYYGIANMELDAADKAGYRYSFSSDGGEIWSSWLPYSSMAKLELPISATYQLYNLAGKLQVKFRGPAGTVGEPKNITVDGVNANDRLWAVMTPESLTPRKDGDLALLVEKPANVTVTAVSANVVKDTEGDFKVSANGLYEFTLQDSETTKTKSYVIVVDVYDTTPPVGVVTYSTTAPTSANVTATLETSEPVFVQKIEVMGADGSVTSTLNGNSKYLFTENGSARFTFKDAAGNVSTADAVVNNIDREGPDVVIVEQYSDGKGNTYATASTAGGGTVSHGMFLTLQKTPGGNGKNYTVVSGDLSDILEVTANGTYSFTVQDDMGNVSKVSKTVTSIAGEIPTPVVNYRYESAENVGLIPGGTNFKNDKVVATISIPAPEDGRQIYVGKMSMQGAQPLTLTKGCYVLEKTYQANGSVSLWFNDGLGGTEQVTINVTGIDRTKPTLKLNMEETTLKIENDQTIRNEQLAANMGEMLGGYTATDAETPDNITVSLTDINGEPIFFSSSNPGVHTVRYKVVDAAGNENFTDQTVYLIPADDMFIKADAEALVNGGSNTAILKTNKVRFTVGQQELEQMFYRGTKVYNKNMRYDIYYTNGLYREGQMKYVASKLTGEDMISNSYQVTFDKPGWYTIIIRNQERSRVYTSFFISTVAD